MDIFSRAQIGRAEPVPGAARLWSRLARLRSRLGLGSPGRSPVLALASGIALSALALGIVAAPALALLGRAVGGLADRVGGPVSTPELGRLAQPSVVVARDGTVLAHLVGEEYRTIVPLEDVPQITRRAVIAIEDAGFWEHSGISVGGMARATWENFKAGDIVEGGSTITQQLVKQTLTGSEQTLERKLREIKLALAIEERMTKEEILGRYLNQVYLSNGVYGVGTAATYYFDKPVGELTLAESALLAGMIKAPVFFDPLKRPERAKERRAVVLRRMTEEGVITRAQAAKAAAEPLGAQAHELPPPKTPYFVEYVKSLILDDPRFGQTREERADALFRGGLRIETTLDPRLQEVSSEAVAEILDDPNDPAAALVGIEAGSGAIRAMVAGRDFEEAKYNLAVQARRQPGSAFKPFTMIAALQEGFPPEYRIDAPSRVTIPPDGPGAKPWEVRNYDGLGRGRITMRRATELSVNTYYAQLIDRVGPARAAAVAESMGIRQDLPPYRSLALGTIGVSPLEMASAYATLAADGTRCEPLAITTVLDPTGQVVRADQPSCRPVLNEDIARTANQILEGVIRRGTGRRASFGRPAAGKTGTTEDYADAWFVGHTPQFAAAVWIGYPESNERSLYNIQGWARVYGGSLPAMIWREFMAAAHDGLAVQDFPDPGQVRYAERAERPRTEREPEEQEDDGSSTEGTSGGDEESGSSEDQKAKDDDKSSGEASPSPSEQPSEEPTSEPSPEPSPTGTATSSPSPSPSG